MHDPDLNTVTFKTTRIYVDLQCNLLLKLLLKNYFFSCDFSFISLVVYNSLSDTLALRSIN